jgi:Lrp/AsnC family transcriptional regulator, leucine-responsive regulatory protein
VDRRIAAALIHEGRISFQELGRRVHLSANSAADRVRRLQRSGVISGYSASLDLSVLGRNLFALSDTKLRPEVNRLEFERQITDVPQVLTATHTTGEYDYQLRLACSGTEELEVVVDRLRSLGVREIHSRIVLSEVTFDPARVLDLAADHRKSS